MEDRVKYVWRLCKNSDETAKLLFDCKFDDMIAYVQAEARVEKDKLDTKVKWLRSLLETKEKWAACYTYQLRSFGIHSTQRAEAIHSSIAVFRSKRSTMMEIVRNLERMAEEHNIASNMAAVDAMLGQTIGMKPVLQPACNNLASVLHPFPRLICNAQSVQIVRYQCSEIANEANLEQKFRIFVNDVSQQSDVEYEVLTKMNCAVDHGIDQTATNLCYTSPSPSHVASLLGCTCQFPQCWGLPCRHMFRVMFHLGCTYWEQALIVSYISCIIFSNNFLLRYTTVVLR